MRHSRLTWQLYLAFLVVMLISLAGISWVSARSFNRLWAERTVADVNVRSALLLRQVEPLLPLQQNIAALRTLCREAGASIQTRITIILPNGKVIADSDADPDTMENHAYRPEIIEAIANRTGISTRLSATMHRTLVYVAVPIKDRGAVAGVLRLALPIAALDEVEHRFYFGLFLSDLLILVFLTFAAIYLSRRISRPLKEMQAGAARFAAGDLAFKLPVSGGEEMSSLARAINMMVEQLNDRIQTITRQHAELQAILSSMTEGVIAVDGEERIISINAAAARMLGILPEEASGRWMHEIVRSSALQRFLRGTLSGSGPSETALQLSAPEGDRQVQAHGAPLSGGTGALIVLADVTALRRLELIRKEFVANVSHELRTPLTSIKGFVETILNGGYQLPEEVVRFLGIISSRTDRLCSIVDDLLSLSSIEPEHERKEVVFVEGSLRTILEEALETCHSRIVTARIRAELECPPDLTLTMNASLLEQAVVNLIDNAVKYSPADSTIAIRAFVDSTHIVLEVADHGIGIASEHLDRIFERFYRVDKARSRKLGGTGLGLSIVKNITEAHNGKVSVSSAVGSGSVFRITLPKVHEPG